MATREKVLALHSSSELYGADRIFARVLQFLCSDGYSVDAYVPKKGLLCAYIESNSSIKVQVFEHFPVAVRSAFGFLYLLRFLLKGFAFYFFLKKRAKRYDYLYINTMSLFFCVFLGRLAGYKNIIIHSHEIISCHGYLARIMSFIAIASCTKLICVSEAVRSDLLISSGGRFKEKINVIHNGVAAPINGGCRTRRREDIYNKINYLLVGRIMPEKGQWFVIDSLALLDKKIIDRISFTFVGGAAPNREKLLDDLRARINKLGLGDTVNILEFKTELSATYPDFDVCVIPSMMADPFPTTVLEAMSYKKPVIVTNHGGATEIVRDGFSGVLVTPGDCTQLSEAIAQYVKRSDLISIHGCNGYKYFQQNLTLDAFKKRFLRAFS
ncbi:glycosyltransferase family 4 protein [Azoarcus sp. PA01]|nr:glycosyltransferase family 4 protein [Azoarcus sp. PA01]